MKKSPRFGRLARKLHSNSNSSMLRRLSPAWRKISHLHRGSRLKLNLGCGRRKLLGYVNVDAQAMEDPDVVCDLGIEQWPWADNSVDAALASHVLEHLPGESFFHFLRELYRVCKAGATIDVVLPHPSHDIFLNDATHARAVMPGTLAMFSKHYVETLAKKGLFLTPFYKYHGVDFSMPKVMYTFDAAVDKDDPELEWKAKHLRNIIFEWSATLTVVK